MVNVKFTVHSLERGLERILHYEKPYTQRQLDNMRHFILKVAVFHPIKDKWVLPDYDAELVIRDGYVITILIKEAVKLEHKPLTEEQKNHSKKYFKSKRNNQ